MRRIHIVPEHMALRAIVVMEPLVLLAQLATTAIRVQPVPQVCTALAE